MIELNAGPGASHLHLMPEDEDTPTFKRILTEILPPVLHRFSHKSREYGDTTADELGVRAQFVDVNRKMVKLRTALWEGRPEQLTSEPIEEVIDDLIAHLLLTQDMLARDRQDALAGSIEKGQCPWFFEENFDPDARCQWDVRHLGKHRNANGDEWV